MSHIGSMLIIVSIDTAADTVKPWTVGHPHSLYIACLPSYWWYSLHLGLATDGWPGWVDLDDWWNYKMLWSTFKTSLLPVGLLTRPDHRPRKVFQSAGQTGVKTKAIIGSGYRRGSPPPSTGVRGFHPRKCLKILCAKWVILWQKLQFIFIIRKLQFLPKLLVTNGSLKLSNEKLY